MATIDLLAAQLAEALRPLAYAMQSEDVILSLVARLGWTLPAVPPSLSALGEDMARLEMSFAELILARSQAEETNDSSAVDSALKSLAANVALAVTSLHALPAGLRAELPADFVAATRIDQEFERRLLDWLIASHIAQGSRVAYHSLRLAGVIEGGDELRDVLDRMGIQMAFEPFRIRWDRLFRLLDPASLAREVYGWGTPSINGTRLFEEIVPLSFALCMPAELRYATSAFIQKTALGTNPALEAVPQLWVPIFEAADVNFFVVASVLPKASAGELQGIALALVPSAATALTIPLGESLELTFEAAAEVGTGVALILRPDHAPSVVLDMDGPGGNALTGGRIAAAITWRAAEWEKPEGMSANGGTHITARSVSVGLGAEGTAGNIDVFAELVIDEGKLVVAPPKEDGLLSSVLPPEGMTAPFSLAVRWSRDGVRFRGSAGLATTIPLYLTVGPLHLLSLDFAIKSEEGSVVTQAALTASFRLGPATLMVERVGLAAVARVAQGNLGPLDLDFRFKSPSGIGVAIDSPGVSGGGYLFLDREKGQYAGVIQLNLDGGITVTAIGMIATRMPNGGKGFSFVVMITAQDFKPIPLGLGFTLTGIGGLLAINRTCNEEVLREGIRNKTLNYLLFPKDPIRNAAQILGKLNDVFPPKQGSYLFGPVVQICWGTPPVLTMDLGLILELGNRTRLIVLGRVSAILPSEKHDLLRLQMNTLGVIDFDRRSIALDAVLYDSRLVNKFPLTGSMAMRLNWGASPTFALSLGGFHPAFKPPPNFPAQERLAISLADSADFRLRLEGYFAITSNTLQFGAKAELFAKAHGFSVAGMIGYDVLIQFDPFAFVADFYASVQIKRGSRNLFKVQVKGQLAGPRPLHIKGKVTFEIFWIDITIPISHTFLSGEPPPRLEPVKVMERLKAALDDPRNWSGQLADSERRAVTLRESQAPNQIALHPLGKLSVKQTVVPLELEIAKFGGAKPSGARLFKINSFSVNGKSVVFKPEKDFFSPAQFLELSDDEKLAAPSFEAMTAGVSVGADSFIFAAGDRDIIEDEAITFETFVIDKKHNESQKAAPFTITAVLLNRQILLGAAARSDIRRTGAAKFRPAESKNSPVKKGWTIAATADGAPQAAPGLEAGKVVSYAESFQALQKLKAENPAKAKELMLIRVSAPVK